MNLFDGYCKNELSSPPNVDSRVSQYLPTLHTFVYSQSHAITYYPDQELHKKNQLKAHKNSVLQSMPITTDFKWAVTFRLSFFCWNKQAKA